MSMWGGKDGSWARLQLPEQLLIVAPENCTLCVAVELTRYRERSAVKHGEYIVRPSDATTESREAVEGGGPSSAR